MSLVRKILLICLALVAAYAFVVLDLGRPLERILHQQFATAFDLSTSQRFKADCLESKRAQLQELGARLEATQEELAAQGTTVDELTERLAHALKSSERLLEEARVIANDPKRDRKALLQFAGLSLNEELFRSQLLLLLEERRLLQAGLTQARERKQALDREQRTLLTRRAETTVMQELAGNQTASLLRGHETAVRVEEQYAAIGKLAAQAGDALLQARNLLESTRELVARLRERAGSRSQGEEQELEAYLRHGLDKPPGGQAAQPRP